MTRMTRYLIALVMVILIGAAIGIASNKYGPGYVTLTVADYTIVTSSLWVFGSLVIIYILLYYFIRFMATLLNIPGYLGQRHVQRKSERAKNALIKALIEMSEGRFEQAEKILARQAEQDESSSLLNYLMAARSAQQLGAYERRDEYLRLAHESTPSADIAIGLTQAELQLSHKQFEQALATLNHLAGVSPKHGYVKKLLARTYQQLGDWDNLAPILNELRKYKTLDTSQLEETELSAYYGMLKNSIKQVDGEKTQRIWQAMPKRLKSNAELIYLYANYLNKYDKGDEAEGIIRAYLSHQWHDGLALLYSNLKGGDCKRQLESAETWVHTQARNATLLLVLGKLCCRCELWGKARSYFESSIGIQPLAEAYLQLAQLLEERMEEPEQAQKMYRLGLLNAVESQPENSLVSIQAKSDTSFKPLLKVIQ